MNLNLNAEMAVQIVNIFFYQYRGQTLNEAQTVLASGSFDNLTYDQMAYRSKYSPSYLCRDVGHNFFRAISEIFKARVTKKNFRDMILKVWQKYTQAIFKPNRLEQILPPDNIDLFTSMVVLNDTFYVERPPIEKICHKTISKPGACIWIRGRTGMGKTSLVKQIFQSLNSSTQRVYLDLDFVDREIVPYKNKLLQWLFTTVFLQLNLEDKVQDDWYKNIQNIEDNNHCTDYFETHILAKTESNIVLALENIDKLFYYPEVTESLLTLLFSWYQKAQVDPHWSKLKLIVTQSTETDIPPDLDSSLVDLGTFILLGDLNFKQVKQLADFYQLDWEDWEISRLMDKQRGNLFQLRLKMHQARVMDIGHKGYI